MRASQAGLEADWGFSCLVEDNGWRILFDTGGNGSRLLRNFAKLNLEAHHIGEIFISHSHWDHLGGLSDIVYLNPAALVYLPGSCGRPHYAGQAIWVHGPCALSEQVFSTGELQEVERILLHSEPLPKETQVIALPVTEDRLRLFGALRRGPLFPCAYPGEPG